MLPRFGRCLEGRGYIVLREPGFSCGPTQRRGCIKNIKATVFSFCNWPCASTGILGNNGAARTSLVGAERPGFPPSEPCRLPVSPGSGGSISQGSRRTPACVVSMPNGAKPRWRRKQSLHRQVGKRRRSAGWGQDVWGLRPSPPPVSLSPHVAVGWSAHPSGPGSSCLFDGDSNIP